jgi:hypothetical protein
MNMVLKNKKSFGFLSIVAVSVLLSGGVLSASAEDQGREREQAQGSQPFKGDQPNYSNNREQNIESGMEPVVVQPSRSDAGALVQPGKAALYSAAPELSNINYRLGAPIMSGPITIYEIWYGTWSNSSSETPVAKAYQTFTNNFLTAAVALGEHWAINKTYYQAAKATPASRTPVGDYSTAIQQRVIPVNATKYKSPLSQSSIYNLAKDTFFPTTAKADPNGIYVVLTSSEIKVSGFGTQFCGWHSYNASSGAKYSFVGDPATTPGCLAQTIGPNLAGADAMLSVLMHELEETATDPQLNAWYSANGNENGDKCAWVWGSTTTTSNGSFSNMNVRGKNYLIQQNFKLGTLATSTSTTHSWTGTCSTR